MRAVRVTGILLGACLLLYGGLTAGVYWAMCQPLDRFGAIMQRVPGVAMAVLPFEPLWMRVRAACCIRETWRRTSICRWSTIRAVSAFRKCIAPSPWS